MTLPNIIPLGPNAKRCQNCFVVFQRRARQQPFSFRNQRYCSRKCFGYARIQPLTEASFMESVIPEPNSGCWLWLGSETNSGYGCVRHKGKNLKAHRASWLLFRGPLKRRLSVCHKCDNPPCVNPDHLFLGTHQENMRDMVRKGRTIRLKGSAHPGAKLTELAVLAIRNDRRRSSIIASEYGVARRTIQAIRLREIWGHL